jgi:hypothetical protein
VGREGELHVTATTLSLVGLALSSLTLSACTKSITQDRPIITKMPVIVPCVVDRPTAPASLKSAYPDEQWAAMDVRQKAAAAGKWGLDQQAYGRRLDASTAGCE